MHGCQRLTYVLGRLFLVACLFANNGCGTINSDSKCQRLDSSTEQVKLADGVFVKQLCDNIWLHTTWHRFEGSARPFPSNGIVIIDEGQAVIVDTPCTDQQTIVLCDWIQDVHNVKVSCVVPTHWHIDCAGGLGAIHKKGAGSIALARTIEILREKKLPIPRYAFEDSKTIRCGRLKIELYYPGPGHTEDNIVAYIPSCKTLFGGCMVKNAEAAGLGNIAEADLDQWSASLQRVKSTFPKAEVVIPGHGPYSGYDAVDHTIALLESRKEN